MTFDARQATKAAEAQYSPFPFTDLVGNEHELPNPYMLNPAELREQLGLADNDSIESVDHKKILEVLSPGALKAIDDMAPIIQKQLIEAWVAHCGLELDDEGKGRSPSSPKKKAGKRSKRT